MTSSSDVDNATALNMTELFDVSAYLERNLGVRSRPAAELAILTIVYCVVFTTGVVGNVCTGVVVWRRAYMHTPTNLYLCSLAISDLLTLLLGEQRLSAPKTDAGNFILKEVKFLNFPS